MAITYIVASGKGGAGKSSTTVCLANALTKRNKKVLCIDGDIGLKSLDILLNIGEEAVFNWQDVILETCTADNALLISKEGVSLLCPPLELDASVNAETFQKMLDAYKDGFDYIFIDLPAGWTAFSEIAAKAADKALLITTPDAVCVRGAAYASEKISEFLSDIRLIVNCFIKDEALGKKQISLDDCVDKTVAGLIGVIPEDDSVARLALGKSLSDYVKSAFYRTASRIDGENVPFRSKKL